MIMMNEKEFGRYVMLFVAEVKVVVAVNIDVEVLNNLLSRIKVPW